MGGKTEREDGKMGGGEEERRRGGRTVGKMPSCARSPLLLSRNSSFCPTRYQKSEGETDRSDLQLVSSQGIASEMMRSISRRRKYFFLVQIQDQVQVQVQARKGESSVDGSRRGILLLGREEREGGGEWEEWTGDDGCPQERGELAENSGDEKSMENARCVFWCAVVGDGEGSVPGHPMNTRSPLRATQHLSRDARSLLGAA